MTVLKKSMLIMAVSLLAWAQVSFADTSNTIMTTESEESIVSKVNNDQTQISFMYCNSNKECSNIGKESYEIKLIEKQILGGKHPFNVLNALNNSLARSGKEFGIFHYSYPLLPTLLPYDEFYNFLDDLKEGLATLN